MLAPKLPTGRPVPPKAADFRTVRHARIKVGKYLRRRLKAQKNHSRHVNNGRN